MGKDIVKARHYSREWKRNNRTRVRAYNNEWQKKHPEQKKIWAARYRSRHKEKIAAKMKIWRNKNSARLKIYSRSQRHARRALGTIPDWLYLKLLIVQKYKCRHCETRLERNAKPHMDHILPVSKGGTNAKENLQLLCEKCNLSKGPKYETDFLHDRHIFDRELLRCMGAPIQRTDL